MSPKSPYLVRALCIILLMVAANTFFLNNQFFMTWLWMNVSYLSIKLFGHDNSSTVAIILFLLCLAIQALIFLKIILIAEGIRAHRK